MTTENPTIETQCSGCSRVLRVPIEHAGKQARCPVCGNISIIPGGAVVGNRATSAGTLASPEEDEALSASPRGWSMRTPEGQIYGPIRRSELDQWVADGRVTSDCELREGPLDPTTDGEGDGAAEAEAAASAQWLAADRIYPQLRPVTWTGSSPAAGHSSIHPGIRPSQFSPATSTVEMARGAYLAPHRGGLVLMLGILGLAVTCPIFSLMAWVMGSADLREMRAGRMDRSGEGLTQVGHILGAVISVLWIGGCVIAVFFIILAAS